MRGKRRGFSPAAAVRHRGWTRVSLDYSQHPLPLTSTISQFFEIGHLLVLRTDFNDFNVRSQNEEMSDLKKSENMVEDDYMRVKREVRSEEKKNMSDLRKGWKRGSIST